MQENVADSKTSTIHRIKNGELLDLFKYFDEAGNKVKQNMINVVTWLLAMNTAILGYAGGKLKGFSGLCDSDKAFALALGIVGFLIAAYVTILIVSFGRTMRLNWNNANKLWKHLEQPEELKLVLRLEEGERILPTICLTLLVVVAGYLLAFAAVIWFASG